MNALTFERGDQVRMKNDTSHDPVIGTVICSVLRRGAEFVTVQRNGNVRTDLVKADNLAHVTKDGKQLAKGLPRLWGRYRDLQRKRAVRRVGVREPVREEGGSDAQV